MDTDLQPHHDQIKRVGRILWGFSLFWMIFNSLAFLTVITTIVVLGACGRDAATSEAIINALSQSDLVPGLDKETMSSLLQWDYGGFLDHFWLTMFYTLAGTAFFVVTMIIILKIASCWKRSDVFGDRPIRLFRLLGWIYLIHGVIGQLWGMIGQFVGNSNTCEVIYFSFIRDVSLMSFAGSGTGIEWGFLALALSWILKHAQLMREEQALVV